MRLFGKKRAGGVPLQALLAHGLAMKEARRVAPPHRLANLWVELLSKDRSIKDPVAEAHKRLSRADRRALGDRGYRYGRGTLAPSIKTRNAR